MKTTKDQINAVVWKACDSFRGSMDSSKYKDYILSLLFVKYLSDSHKETLQKLKKEYKDNPEMLQRRLSREKFKLDEKSTFDYLYANKEKENIGEIINAVLEKIEEDNQEKLEGIFRNIDFNDKNLLGNNKERHKILKNLLENFSNNKLDLSPSKLEDQDVMGDAYEYLISEFAGDAGKRD